jgi:septum site-determining protein MinC
MTQVQISFPPEKCFHIKGGRISVTTLELTRYDYAGFNDQLSQAVGAAPQLFEQMPIVLGLEKLAPEAFVDFIEICQICQCHGLTPVAIRGGSPEQQAAATVAGLTRLPAQGRRGAEAPSAAPESQPAIPETIPQQTGVEAAEADASIDTQGPARASRVITAPVRSGQQVYAQGGDLIVMASVSAGAEILADGNIHVYGPLRGRALAGIQGDTEARIFCQSLEAELISIAGHYRINEDLRGALWRRPVKIALADSQLQIEAL